MGSERSKFYTLMTNASWIWVPDVSWSHEMATAKEYFGDKHSSLTGWAIHKRRNNQTPKKMDWNGGLIHIKTVCYKRNLLLKELLHQNWHPFSCKYIRENLPLF